MKPQNFSFIFCFCAFWESFCTCFCKKIILKSSKKKNPRVHLFYIISYFMSLLYHNRYFLYKKMNILHKTDYAKYTITSHPVSYGFWLTQIPLFPFLINWYNGFRNLQKGYFIIINEKNIFFSR